ncbi:CerR family C-terminal domain-containing protein [Paraburkholderia sp. SIMBA_049]
MTTRTPRHRPAAEGGYQRGEETRAKIIEAALSLFGERGFEGASTRDIAEHAGVNAPALVYYFDNKEGVYQACVEYIMANVADYFADAVEAAQAVLDANPSDDALIDAFRTIQARVASYLFTTETPATWRLFMAREQAGLGPAFAAERLNERMRKPLLSVSSEIVGRLLGRPAEDPETVIRLLAINGQLVSFHLTRCTALAALKWKSIDGERLKQLCAIIDEQSVVLLRAMIEWREANIKRRKKK